MERLLSLVKVFIVGIGISSVIITGLSVRDIKHLKKDIILLEEKINGILDLGIQTVKGLENNQNGLIEVFYEIHKLKLKKDALE